MGLRHAALALAVNAAFAGCQVFAQTGREGSQSAEAASAKGNCYVVQSVPLRPGRQDRSEMCKALAENLNQFCESGPMVCGLQISSTSAFTVPDWTRLDVNQNLPLVERLIRGKDVRLERYNPGISDRDWSLVSTAVQDTSRGPASLMVADVDLMNRGTPERIYALTTDRCEVAQDQKIKLDPKILLARDAEVLTNPAWRQAAEAGDPPYPGADQLTRYPKDIFFYDGRAYLFEWTSAPSVEELTSTTVRAAPQDGNVEFVGVTRVCEFRYVGQQE